MDHFRTHRDAILAEYATVRGEIQQLNGQVFSVLCSSLALDIAVLGWLFGKSNPCQFYFLGTVGIILLLMGNLVLLNRNRLAHRLAFFQMYFIEPRLPDLCWGRVWFEYRERYPKAILFGLSERLADSATLILLIASILNLLVLAFLGILPFLAGEPVIIDRLQIVNLAFAAILVGLQIPLQRLFTNYEPVKGTLQQLANECGLNNRPKRKSVRQAPSNGCRNERGPS